MEILSKIMPSFFQGVLGTHVSSLVWLKPIKLRKFVKKLNFYGLSDRFARTFFSKYLILINKLAFFRPEKGVFECKAYLC